MSRDLALAAVSPWILFPAVAGFGTWQFARLRHWQVADELRTEPGVQIFGSTRWPLATEASDCVAVEAWKRRWGEPQQAFTTKSEAERCVRGDGSGFSAAC